MRIALAGALTLATLAPSAVTLPAAATPANQPSARQGSPQAARQADAGTRRLAREPVRYGDQDVSGVVDAVTWRHLIRAIIRGRGAIPDACDDGAGWDACYDRTRHEVTLWHDGRLHNAWLVRGGASEHQTRTGDFRVYYRAVGQVCSLYGSPMPYSQFFAGGKAFHGSTTMVGPFTGHSHGCLDMYVEDAAQLWALTSRVPLAVHVHGAWS